jgi:hypothetical protein
MSDMYITVIYTDTVQSETYHDKMQLWGKISISQNGGQEILTRDLTIDQSNAQKHYYSKNDTTYIANGNKIYAQGIDMNKNLVKLLNTVKIVMSYYATC